MASHLFTVILLFLTIGFFAFHHVQQQYAPITFADTVAPSTLTDETFLQDEFLILMDQGDEDRLLEVLSHFDLELIAPLGEWVQVKKGGKSDSNQILSIRSQKAVAQLQFVDEIERHDAIHSASLNYLLPREYLASCFRDSTKVADSRAVKVPHDPFFRHQWYLQKESGINLPGAWAITTGNPSTVIAVVDRHFDVSGSDLSSEKCSSRRYYYENVLDYFPQKRTITDDEKTMHGSQVLSVVAPCTDNAVGLAGIDWHAQVFSVDSLSDSSLSARMFGILWAAGIDICTKSITGCPANFRFQRNQHPASVINTSFGFAGPSLKDPPYGPVLDVMSSVNRQGRIVVASAGNEGGLADRRLPGAAGGVISVGASTKKRESAWFSNFGRTVDVMAPGEEIIGLENGRPISLSGTSFSAPIITGVVSLMLAANPLLSWKHAEYILKKTADPLSCNAYCPTTMNASENQVCRKYCCDGERSICASGIINAERAVATAKEGFPNVALVDVDDYYVALSRDNNLKSTIIVKNWGGKKAKVRLKKTDPHLKMTPEALDVLPIDSQGIPGLATATLFYEVMPDRQLVTNLILQAANSSSPLVFHDQIEAIVEIVPDGPIKKKRLLRELSAGN